MYTLQGGHGLQITEGATINEEWFEKHDECMLGHNINDRRI